MKTLYLDMDGVVADFDEYANRTLGLPPSAGVYPPDQWKKLAENARLYQELKPTYYAGYLVNYCNQAARKLDWNLMFLTAVPKDNDMPWAFYDKVLWVQSHFPMVPVMFGPYSKDKYSHCHPGDILIDDRVSNCEAWRSVGGIAIQHQGDPETTIKQLRDIINDEMSKQ